MQRRTILGVLTLLIGAATAILLLDVLATVFLAITVTYVLTPVYRWFESRGLHPWWASAATSGVAIVGALLALAPLVILLVLRLSQVIALIETVPRSVTLSAFGFTTTVGAGDVIPLARAYVEALAVNLAAAVPVLGIKLTLFGLLVFALLMGQRRARMAVIAIVPPAYHDVVRAFDERARTTLFAIYVVQAGTAVGTFLVALPVFLVLGYAFPVTLATIAGLLQFLPIVGPSVLIGLLAAFDFAVGNVTRGVLVILVAGVLVAWLPDPLLRPRLARQTANFPGSLYFVGFTGGLFSLGVVGIVAGPLVVALLVESVSLLAAEMNHDPDEALTAGDRSREPDRDSGGPLLEGLPSPFGRADGEGDGPRSDEAGDRTGNGDEAGPGSDREDGTSDDPLDPDPSGNPDRPPSDGGDGDSS